MRLAAALNAQRMHTFRVTLRSVIHKPEHGNAEALSNDGEQICLRSLCTTPQCLVDTAQEREVNRFLEEDARRLLVEAIMPLQKHR